MKDSLGDRMKRYYEDRNRVCLNRRTPVILRLDGRAFHTLTRQCERPFDDRFISAMQYVASQLVQEIQGAVIAYVQSDEISLFLRDYDRLTTEAWFDYNVQKMVSISASMASVWFSQRSCWGNGYFDCRAFNIPREEVTNYFIWRQMDWTRNSLSMLAQANFSHKELQGKNQVAMHEMLHQKSLNWAIDLPPQIRNGTFIRKSDGMRWFGILKDHRLFVEREVNYEAAME